MSDEERGKHFTVRDFAKRMQISEKQARRIVEAGEIKHLRIGRLIRITKYQIEEYENKKSIEIQSA